MTPEERDLITGLFQRLKSADSAPKDREAEDLINKRVVELPSAPYLLAQTVLVQEHALNNAQARLGQLEAELAEAKQAKADAGAKASFLGGMLGRGPWGPREEAPPAPAAQPVAPPQPAPQAYAPPRYAGGSVPFTGSGGGFLQSALTTAAGVAGGALLYDGIRSLFFHNPGPFGSAMGAGWGQPGGVTETTNVVNNYYGSDPNQAGSSGFADAPDTTPGEGLQDASFQDASFQDASFRDDGFQNDGGSDFDSGGGMDLGGGGDSDLA